MQILRVSKNEKVVVLEDYLIVYFQLTPAHKVHHEFGEYMGSPFVTIQELTKVLPMSRTIEFNTLENSNQSW